MAKEEKKHFSVKKYLIIILATCIVIAGIVFAVVISVNSNQQPPEPEIVTVATLQQIVNVSELSTFTAIYNGVSEVKNLQNPNLTDYFVAYEAKVNAGIDFSKIEIQIEESRSFETKVVRIKVPEVYITDINVDVASLDFMFVNNAANTSTVSEDAYKKCEVDVHDETKNHKEIFELARQNAENVIKALVQPFLDHADEKYELIIEQKEAE